MTTYRKSTDEEIAAICRLRAQGASVGEIAALVARPVRAIAQALRDVRAQAATAAVHAARAQAEDIEDAPSLARRDDVAEACALHMADLERAYPGGPPWRSLPVSHERGPLPVSLPLTRSMIGSSAAMCEG